MFSCVAVTRGGWGDVWGFESPEAARSHPIVQEGDAVVDSPETVADCWNFLFLPRMYSEVLGDAAKDALLQELFRVGVQRLDTRHLSAATEALADLRRIAKKPPEKPEDIVLRIREDRRLYDEWYRREQTRRSSVTQAQGAASTEGAKAKTESNEPKKIAGHAPTAKISFGKDKEGNDYNTTDNNPKRAGSKSGERFAKYKAGMTLEAATEAGVSAADIKWDIDHGFIAVS